MIKLIIGVLCVIGMYLCIKEIERLDRLEEEEAMEEIRNVIEQVEFIQSVREKVNSRDNKEVGSK